MKTPLTATELAILKHLARGPSSMPDLSRAIGRKSLTCTRSCERMVVEPSPQLVRWENVPDGPFRWRAHITRAGRRAVTEHTLVFRHGRKRGAA